MNLQEAVLALSALETESKEESTRHSKAMEDIKARREKLSMVLYELECDMDPDRIERGKRIVNIKLSASIDAFRMMTWRDPIMAVLRDAALDAAGGFKRLRERQFGLKEYEQFEHQRCDCEYGYGPCHGCIMFEIGLNRDCLGKQFTPEEIEDAIYYIEKFMELEPACRNF